MRPGQKVILKRAYRAYGVVGGWKWDELQGEIVTLKKKTAVVRFITNYGNVSTERHHISRLRPIHEEIKVNMKVKNLQLEISG